jgi:DHA1 family tetracycline resistance protein-like MFS transporter
MDQSAKPKRQAALGFIFATLLIDVMGLAIIIPVVPQLIEHLIKGDISKASYYGGLLTASYATMQFLFSPFIGNLSDKFGRRPVLLCSLLGFSVDYFFSAFAPTIGWLFVGRLVAGITGASFTTASAYISDVSTPEKKAANFGMIGVAFGLGFIIGPAIGGFLGNINIHYPFIAAGTLAFLNAMYGFFVLPESLHKQNRRAFDLKRANPLGTLKQLAKYKNVLGLAVSLFLIYFAAQAVQSVWTFYTIKKFNWDTKMQGYSLGCIGLCIALVQGGLIRFTMPKLGYEKSIWMGLMLYSIGLILFAFATQSWMMFAFIIPYCLGGIAGPALQGYISNNVPANSQGELQGGLTSLMSLSSIIAPLTMTQAFYFFTRPGTPIQFPGAPYVLGSILMLLSALLAIRSFRKQVGVTAV